MSHQVHRHGGMGVLALLLGLAWACPVAAQEGGAAKATTDEQRVVPDVAPAQPLPSPPPQAAVKAPAVMKLLLPAQGLVWIENLPMSTTGPVRLFQSPPLEPGKTYIYKVKVSWPTQQGRPDFVLEQEVAIKAGLTTTVDFAPVVQASYQVPVTPTQQGQVQPGRVQPPPVQQPSRLPARRQVPNRGGY